MRKIAPYETPYKDIVAELMGRNNSYHDMKDAKKINLYLHPSFVDLG